MQIHRSGAEPAAIALETNFTGTVAIHGYFQRAAPSRLAGATVVFPAGTRTPWKTPRARP